MGVDSRDYSTVVLSLDHTQVKVGSIVITEQLNGLEGLNYLYSCLLVSLSILCDDVRSTFLNTKLTPISTVLRAATGIIIPYTVDVGTNHTSKYGTYMSDHPLIHLQWQAFSMSVTIMGLCHQTLSLYG